MTRQAFALHHDLCPARFELRHTDPLPSDVAFLLPYLPIDTFGGYPLYVDSYNASGLCLNLDVLTIGQKFYKRLEPGRNAHAFGRLASNTSSRGALLVVC